MEAKKTRRADLQNRRMLFMEIGLVVALLLVVSAFYWGQTEKTVGKITDNVAPVEEEVIVNTEQEQKPPEVKPQVNQVLSDFLDVVRDDAKIETNYNFDEFDEDFVIAPPEVVVEDVVDDTPVYSADEGTIPPGGSIEAFRKWLYDKIKYPPLAQENNIQGRVVIQFIIERDGTLTGIQASGPHQSLIDEAVRVLKMSDKWVPAKVRNKPVRIYYVLPVDFQLVNN